MSVPTISVILPTYKDGWRLGVQLASIVPQLGPDDELIVLSQGISPETEILEHYYAGCTVNFHEEENPLGVCGGYNAAAKIATKDWILGASGNDELLPSALQAFRNAAEQYPEARVCFGHIVGMARNAWLPSTGFVPADWLPRIWEQCGWATHGAAAFIRRDSWGKGYVPELGYRADHWQTLALAMRHGCIDLKQLISRVSMTPGNFSQGHSKPEIYNATIQAARKESELPEYDDIRPMINTFHRIIGFFNRIHDPSTNTIL